jgi:hypothetical protein
VTHPPKGDAPRPDKNPAPMSHEKAKGAGVTCQNPFRTDSMKVGDFRSVRNVTFDKIASDGTNMRPKTKGPRERARGPSSSTEFSGKCK